MKIRKFISLLLALLLVLSLCACGEIVKTEPEIERAPDTLITDLCGREVLVTPGAYSRVVCIGAGALRMYSYIGDIWLLCGVEDIDNEALAERPRMFDGTARPYVMAFGDVFSALPSCGTGGPNAQSAEAEKILECEPDIILSAYEDADRENALQKQTGVPVITLRTGPDGVFDDAFAESLRLLGLLFDKADRAEELLAFIETQANELAAITGEVKEDEMPRTYIGGLGNWGTTDHRTTAKYYKPFEIAGIRNVIDVPDSHGVFPLDDEEFLFVGADTDCMILDAAAVKNIAPLYAEDPALFDTCRAWRSGMVFLQMAYNAYYTNFEIALANTWFSASCVYPWLFTDFDMTAKLDEITTAFLGKPLAEKIFAAPYSYGGYQQIDVFHFFN